MKKYIIIALIVITGAALIIFPLLNSTEIVVDTKEAPAKFLFKENLATIGEQSVPLEIKLTEEVEKLELFYNDSLFITWTKPKGNIKYELKAGLFGVGTRTLNLLSTLKDGSTFVDNRMVRVLSDIVPERLIAQIENEYPHLSSSFTQGLEFYAGKLYEGTGDPNNQGMTVVAEVDLKTGEHLRKKGLPAGYFGEGITILNNTLYQLTYKNGKCYTYDVANDFQLQNEYSYIGEGWGLCNDGKSLIMSNGSERIVYRNPETFALEHTLEVYDNMGPIINLNELEYIDGKIYANIWQSNFVVVIDPLTGKVLQKIDATSLVDKGKGMGEVLNGIAYDDRTKKMFMTGKYWIKLFEVKFVSAGA